MPAIPTYNVTAVRKLHETLRITSWSHTTERLQIMPPRDGFNRWRRMHGLPRAAKTGLDTSLQLNQGLDLAPYRFTTGIERTNLYGYSIRTPRWCRISGC